MAQDPKNPRDIWELGRFIVFILVCFSVSSFSFFSETFTKHWTGIPPSKNMVFLNVFELWNLAPNPKCFVEPQQSNRNTVQAKSTFHFPLRSTHGRHTSLMLKWQARPTYPLGRWEVVSCWSPTGTSSWYGDVLLAMIHLESFGSAIKVLDIMQR